MAHATLSHGINDIISFCESPWGLQDGITPPLLPVQRFILKAYYGLPLDSSRDPDIRVVEQFDDNSPRLLNEVDFLEWLLRKGWINTTDLSGRRRELIIPIGRRGCKDTLIATIASYELFKLLSYVSPQEHYQILPRDHIDLILHSYTKKNRAMELFTGCVQRSPVLAVHLGTFSAKRLSFRTGQDSKRMATIGMPNKEGTIEVSAMPYDSIGARGRNVYFSSFSDSSYYEAHREELAKRAVEVSLTLFRDPDGTPVGRCVLASDIWPKDNLFYREYRKSLGSDSADLLMIKLPTWIANPTVSTKFLKEQSSSESFDQEYGAVITD